MIHRAQPDFYTKVPNDLARDDEMTYTARGMFVLILSNIDAWEVTNSWLEKHSPQGRQAVRQALQELEKHGYAVYVIKKDKDTHAFTEQGWDFYEAAVPEDKRTNRTRWKPGQPYVNEPSDGKAVRRDSRETGSRLTALRPQRSTMAQKIMAQKEHSSEEHQTEKTSTLIAGASRAASSSLRSKVGESFEQEEEECSSIRRDAAKPVQEKIIEHSAVSIIYDMISKWELPRRYTPEKISSIFDQTPVGSNYGYTIVTDFQEYWESQLPGVTSILGYDVENDRDIATAKHTCFWVYCTKVYGLRNKDWNVADVASVHQLSAGSYKVMWVMGCLIHMRYEYDFSTLNYDLTKGDRNALKVEYLGMFCREFKSLAALFDSRKRE